MAMRSRGSDDATKSLSSKTTDSQTGRLGTKQTKSQIPPPMTLGRFFIIALLHLLRKVLLVRPALKLGIYTCAVVAGSLVTDLFKFPPSYLSDKRNFLNQYFVKLAWGWTLLVMGAFIFLTSFTYCCGNRSLVKRHLSRLGVGTIWWYVCTSLFMRVETVTGFCSHEEHFLDKPTCRENDGEWIGFDISGHAFLLVYCLLLIHEEAKAISGWERIKDIIKKEEEHPSDRLTGQELSQLKISYEGLTPIIRVLMGVLAFFLFVWEVMLLSTVLYFHNMPQKFTGVVFAALGWAATYRTWYKMELSPGLPGMGPFKYMKEF